MTAHVHAALMAEYAKDAAETDKPWERWECLPAGGLPFALYKHPDWDANLTYRRKPVALCQVEGRDVFPGDRLWHVYEGWVTATKQGSSSNHVCVNETLQILITRLSWTEPARTKTVYQWAFTDGYDWKCSRTYYETREQACSGIGFEKVRRLDWTALEVPA